MGGRGGKTINKIIKFHIKINSKIKEITKKGQMKDMIYLNIIPNEVNCSLGKFKWQKQTQEVLNINKPMKCF